MATILNKEQFIKQSFNKNKIVSFDTFFDISIIKQEIESNGYFIFKNKKCFLKGKEYICLRINEINEQLFKDIDKIIYEKYLNKTFNTIDFLEVIRFLFIEFFIFIDLYNQEKISYEELLKSLNLNENVGKKKNNSIRNYDLLQTNNLSFELTKNSKKEFLNGNNIYLKKSIYRLFSTIGFNLLEIPFNYNLASLEKFLMEINKLKKELNIEKLKLNLRFKKLKKIKKYGLYIVNDKTIILDPRNIEQFKHELGHFIYENKIDFQLSTKQINEEERNSIVNLHQNVYSLSNYKNYETYNLDSEVFAYWFENNI